MHARGAAILMAILAVALIAAVASVIIAEHGAAIEQLDGRIDQAQARWLARGAIDWTRNVLQFDKLRSRAASGTGTNVDHARSEWTIHVSSIPVEEGEMSGEIEELDGRFNINNLVSQGVVNAEQQAIFLRLLSNLNVPPVAAQALTDSIIDWIDADDVPRPNGAETSWYSSHQQSILPPQSSLLAVNELLAVRGMTPAILDLLRPHIATLPANANFINVNFASAELLSAWCNIPLDKANTLVTSRQQSYFKSQADFATRMGAAGGYNGPAIDVQSNYFLATGRARWGDAETHMEVVLWRTQGKPIVLRETIL